MRARLAFALLLVAALPALPAGALGPAPAATVELSAASSEGALAVDVTARAGPADVQVVVSHVDPLAGPVVDRVVPVDVDANTTARLVLDDVRPGVALNVSVARADAPVPPLSDVVRLPVLTDALNASLFENVTALVAPRQDGAPHRFATHPVFGSPTLGRLVVQPGGLVGVVYERLIEGTSYDLLYRASLDGGRSFGEPALVAHGVDHNSVSVATGAGDATISFHKVAPPGVEYGAEPTRFVTIDALTGKALRSGALPEDLYGGSSVALPDGVVVLAGLPYPRDATGPGFDQPLPLRVRAILPNGSVGPAVDVPRAQRGDALEGARLAASPTGEVALAWVDADANGTEEWRMARSQDGGRSFGAARAVAGLGGPERAVFGAMALDALGVVHLAYDLHHVDRPSEDPRIGEFENDTSYYARVLPSGATEVTPLNGLYDAAALVPQSRRSGSVIMAVSGPRVALMWDDVRPFWDADRPAATFVVESLDGGRTFGAPYSAWDARGSMIGFLMEMGMLPGGRPLALAHASGSDGGDALSTVPLFDPWGDQASGLVTLATGAAPGEVAPGAVLAPLPAPPGTPDLPGSAPVVPSLPTLSLPGAPAPRTPAPAATPEGGAAQGVRAPALAVAAPALGLAILLGAAAAAGFGRYGLGLATAALSSRLTRPDVLRSDLRAGIHAYVTEHPGQRYEEIRRALGLSNGALAHHLRVLEREGYVVAQTSWGARRYRASGSPAPPPARAVPDDALAFLRRSPGATAADVARGLRMSRQLARYHLLGLERSGHLRSRREGRVPRYYVVSPGGASFERVRP